MQSYVDLAQQLTDERFLANWKFWGLLAAVNLLISYMGSYLGAFSSEKGKFAAISSQFESINIQLAETTRTTKTIEFALSQKDWTEREFKTIRRAKLEEVFLAAYQAREWVGSLTDCKYNESPRTEDSPITRMLFLAELYFPELHEVCDNLLNEHHDAAIKATELRGAIKLADRKLSALNSTIDQLKSGPPLLWEVGRAEFLQQQSSLTNEIADLKIAYPKEMLKHYRNFADKMNMLRPLVREIMNKTISGA